MDLFPPDNSADASSARLIAAVAVEQAIDRELDYLVPEHLCHQIAVGQRVRVPVGRGDHLRFASVVELKSTSDYPISKLKPIRAIDDGRVLLSAQLLNLARWMSRYYLTPLGSVLESVIPSAVKKRTGLGQITLVRSALSRQELHERIESKPRGKTAAILGAMLQLAEDESIDIIRLAALSNATPATIRKLAAKGLLQIQRATDFSLPGPAGDVSFTPEPPLQLNPEQHKAYATIAAQIAADRFGVALLHGVTGSGKTEVYLHAIQQIVSAGRQAIVLVPEIALTPQTALRFTRRYQHVAILHSGLSATQRHDQWRQIAAGRAQVVIGARSAVFAPVPQLGLIVVDEEHESSYKQETAPRYNARDVAIKRAQLEDICVILGSATPSLETYHRIRSAQSAEASPAPARTYLPLPHRVTAQQLPKVTLIDMKHANIGRPGIHLLSPQLETAMRSTFAAGRQAILLLNRRGYASYIWCASCKNVVQCKYCDVAMVYHRTRGQAVHSGRTALAVSTGQLHCHYCMAVNALPAHCPDCGKKLSLFGLGTQRVEEELQQKFPQLAFARVDSDTMHTASDYQRVLGDFAAKRTQLLMGTQMIAKGLDFPDVTLVGVISGDTALMLPDFRAAERTFQIITQVAGRAGRGQTPGTVILQTFMPDDPTIRAAITQDYDGFARKELTHRKEAHLPPFTRMVRIVFRDTDERRLTQLAESVAQKLHAAASSAPDLHIQGPMPCSIGKIAGHARQQIVLNSPHAHTLHKVLTSLRQSGELMRGDRIAIDVDPLSLL